MRHWHSTVTKNYQGKSKCETVKQSKFDLYHSLQVLMHYSVQNWIARLHNNPSLCLLKVFLLPSVLARKRTWNPKYPICIRLAHDVNCQMWITGGGWSKEPGSEPASAQKGSYQQAHRAPTTLYLFGRTGREKEEWFRHFLFASMDAERERQRPGRWVTRSGMQRIGESIHTNVICAWIMDYALQFYAF